MHEQVAQFKNTRVAKNSTSFFVKLLCSPQVTAPAEKPSNVQLVSTKNTLKSLPVVYFHGKHSEGFCVALSCFLILLISWTFLFSSCVSRVWASLPVIYLLAVFFYMSHFDLHMLLWPVQNFCLHGNARWERKSFAYLQRWKMLRASLHKSQRPAQTVLSQKPKNHRRECAFLAEHLKLYACSHSQLGKVWLIDVGKKEEQSREGFWCIIYLRTVGGGEEIQGRNGGCAKAWEAGGRQEL